ncbi:MAG TPA: polyribonucleotide nucleotidyltransferase [Bacteroidota bacterium]|nr:polyribonucleotide nucleotidyltransferase [Bacteroidota bacterium]
MTVTKEINLGGKIFSLETGRFAKQADGAVMARFGDTMVLATVVASKEENDKLDYFPLQVEYREKFASAGKIPGGFFKREARPSEKEVLSSRLIDRPIRPMFPDWFRCETQVIVTVYSSDQEHDGDVLGAVAASAALMLSDIPFEGPIAEVRVGRLNGEMVINPTFTQLATSDMDVTVAGTQDSIVMVEGEAREISEQDMLAALEFAHGYIREMCRVQSELAREIGRAKRVPPELGSKAELMADVRAAVGESITVLAETPMLKEERARKTEEIHAGALAALAEKYPEQEKAISAIVHDMEYAAMREMILAKGKRLDGRGLREIRPIHIEVGLLPRTHGSALFQRGETQSLTTLTLGTKMDEQIIDGLLPDTTKRFMLHYNFPPFSVGEVGRLGTTGRREIGHGNLAERSIKNLMPPEPEFPYTVRIVSDILESNGSSSMATVCAATLALLDGGAPLRRSVAGIAMGLVKEGDRVAILSDILGNEDHLGDMDFKVAGTRDGISAFQMDIKIRGISLEIMRQALEQAKEGRMHILGKMEAVLDKPRPDLSPYAPRLTSFKIPVDLIGALIGPGGKNIRAIVADSGAEINVEDDGTVVVAATSQESADKAIYAIKRIAEVPEVGKVYHSTVKKVTDFGAFVEFLPGKEGLVHVSQLDTKRVEKPSDVVKVGDTFDVKIIDQDDQGRYKLSRKVLMKDSGQAPEGRHGEHHGEGKEGHKHGSHQGEGKEGHKHGH